DGGFLSVVVPLARVGGDELAAALLCRHSNRPDGPLAPLLRCLWLRLLAPAMRLPVIEKVRQRPRLINRPWLDLDQLRLWPALLETPRCLCDGLVHLLGNQALGLPDEGIGIDCRARPLLDALVQIPERPLDRGREVLADGGDLL